VTDSTDTTAGVIAATRPPALDCAGLRKSFGDVPAVRDVSFQVGPGEILALLGPSGCGKTTTLRLIAGFERADAGAVRIGGHPVVDEHRSLPPEARRVGMVFQDYALFPHLTVGANVQYGLDAPSGRSGGLGGRLSRLAGRYVPYARVAPDDRVREALALVSLEDMADRYPHELSGGEAQRVALARALAPRPELILLDEPFSNLDTRLRASVRAEVRAILKRAGAAAVFVTHDQEEAFSLADRVGVMWEGRVAQLGTPLEIYRRPATRAVAAFVGDADFLPGRAADGVVTTALGSAATVGEVGRGDRVEAMLRPETVRVVAGAASDPPGDGNWVTAQVIEHTYYGHDQVIALRLAGGALVHARLDFDANHAVGDTVRLRVEGPIVVFPAPAPPESSERR
jgi:iron(III) transport system ATP-binding protein